MRWSPALEMFPPMAPTATAPGQDAQWQALALLAWQLRQRDSAQASQHAQQVLTLLTHISSAETVECTSARARMQLVLAEVALLALRLDEAHVWLNEAEQGFLEAQDRYGLCDLHWLRHYEAADRGQAESLRQSLEKALTLAEALQDAERTLMLQATLARSELFRDQNLANKVWHERLPLSLDGLSAAAAAAVADFRGLQNGLSSEFAPAARWLEQGYELALASGQLRRAMSMASNLGFTFTSMSDYAQAVEWLQRGLSLARQAAWPGALCLALAQTGDAMRRIGQTRAARDMLLECQALLAQHPQNRSAMLALKYLGETELDLQENEAALASFEQLGQLAGSVDSKDMQTDAALGQARALLRLKRLTCARDAARYALEIAQEQRERSTLVDIHWTLAEIEQAGGSSPPSVLTHLHEALQQGQRLPGYRLPPALLEAAAAAHFQAGDAAEAYRLSQRAGEVRQQSFTEESSKQAAVLHVQHQVERSRAEQAHLRQLAQSEADRAQALQRLHEVLLQLGDIGKEITAQLDLSRVLDVLQGHVHALLKTRALSVYLLDDSKQWLHCALGCQEAGNPDSAIAVTDPDNPCSRAWRERTELLLGGPPKSGESPETGTCMVAPLQVADRAIGVMRVQSEATHSYGERDQLVFRSLCAYAAIALDNAHAYEQLSELQRQVAAQEKMASIGQLAAGVAHEINNPIGFINSNLGSLDRDVGRMIQLIGAYRAMDRGDWPEPARRQIEAMEQQLDIDFLAEDLPQLLKESIDGLQRVKRIVQDLRNFSRVDSSDWADADLNEGLCSTLNMLQHEIRYKAEVRSELGALPPVHCLAAQLNQVFMNLLVNASHAIVERGFIELRTWQDGDWACISIRDNGCGMSQAVQARIFEPFFTTKPVGQGTGLGLSLSFSIIKKHEGRIEVDSTPGIGTCFTLRIPVRGPG